MYDYIVNAIRAENKFTDEEALKKHLEGLQQNVKYLRASYRSYPVHIDYSTKENQAAYLITYFPHYALLLWHVLLKHFKDIDTYSFPAQSLWLFGGGPCPELVSYLRLLQHSELTFGKSIDFTCFDIWADTWTYSREMNLNYISPFYSKVNTINKSEIVRFDISETIKELPENMNPTMAVFQNCLNESPPEKHQKILDFMNEVE